MKSKLLILISSSYKLSFLKPWSGPVLSLSNKKCTHNISNTVFSHNFSSIDSWNEPVAFHLFIFVKRLKLVHRAFPSDVTSVKSI